jgi:hypothetical protein
MTVLGEQIPNLARSQRPSLDRSLDTVIDTTLAMNRMVGAVVVVATPATSYTSVLPGLLSGRRENQSGSIRSFDSPQ